MKKTYFYEVTQNIIFEKAVPFLPASWHFSDSQLGSIYQLAARCTLEEHLLPAGRLKVQLQQHGIEIYIVQMVENVIKRTDTFSFLLCQRK